MRTLHLTWILLIAVISMRGHAMENDTAAISSVTHSDVMPPPGPIPVTTAQPATTASSTPTIVTTTGTPNTTNSTTAVPTVPTSTLVPTTLPATTSSTTASPNTTTAQPMPVTNATTVGPTSPATTVKPISSTSSALTTERPDGPTQSPSKDRHFDGLSFMGGIILAGCLVTIGVFSWKFYKVRQDRNYRTL